MQRRTFLAGSSAVAAGLAAPSILRAAGSRLLRFIPSTDVTILDPIWTTAYVTRNHGFMIFDTLYGIDNACQPRPQMVAGHTIENDARLWKLTLRDGLAWHDGERVLARDCVASIRRWARRDPFGQTLMACTDELSAADDKTIVFRLNRPFALLPDALGKPGSNFCAMMPERLATTDAFKPVTEMVGSGPFRWNARERVVGALAVYERNEAYQPRPGEPAQSTSGPKVVHFDRVEWHVIPDESTKANALITGEVDWWENPTSDMLGLVRHDPNCVAKINDETGTMSCMRLNQLWPPFDNPAIRRALLSAVDQSEFMTAAAGTDREMWTAPVGFFCPGLPMASDARLEVFKGSRDFAAVKQALTEAGYGGEKVILLVPTDQSILKQECDVCADMLKQIGMNVDYQAMDWGTVVQRRAMMDPPDKGGWNLFITGWSGLDQSNPVGHVFLRGNGKSAMMGWPDSPKIEALRQEWIDAPDQIAQKQLAVELQRQAFTDVPYVPLGQYFAATAHHKDLTDMLSGFVKFWNVRRG